MDQNLQIENPQTWQTKTNNLSGIEAICHEFDALPCSRIWYATTFGRLPMV